MLVLLIERFGWMYASVDEETLPVIMKEREGAKPIDVRRWYIASIFLRL